MKNTIKKTIINEVSDHANLTVVPFPEQRRGIQFLPSVSAYADRVFAGYDTKPVWSINTATVSERIGPYDVDIIHLKFASGKPVKVFGTAAEQAQPTELEEKAIAAELADYAWPQNVPFDNPDKVPVPYGEVETRYDYMDTKGRLMMVEYRLKNKAGFPCVTNWDDGEDRWTQPLNGLPLLGLERLTKDTTTVFIGEGGKAQLRAGSIADGLEPYHPWAQELSGAVHLGFTGGAYATHRTDWSPINKKGMRVYVVLDNDTPGLNAIVPISKALTNCIVMGVRFDKSKFPPGFDLGDDFPKNLFVDEEVNGRMVTRYTGPTFGDSVFPATFMTTEKIVKGKKVWDIRSQWLEQFRYSATDDLFLNIHSPRKAWKAAVLNRLTAPFKHPGAQLTASQCITESLSSHVAIFEYRPDKPHGRFDSREFGNADDIRFNTFVPTPIKPQKGDTRLFHELLKHMFQDEDERIEVLRWFYTLVGRTDIKMRYALLLISEQSGTGKSTLLLEIAVPLVGRHNCSSPKPTDVFSDFNDWLVNRRYVNIDEMYIGGKDQHDFADKIKSIITQDEVWFNPKGFAGKMTRNSANTGASSNSPHAIDIDPNDRRWFIPMVNEVRWDEEKFKELYRWLNNGGHAALLYEAQNLTEVPGYVGLTYVSESDKAPMTSRKEQAIEDSLGEAQVILREIMSCVADDEKVCFPVSFVQNLMKKRLMEQRPKKEIYSKERAANFVPREFKKKRWIYSGKNEKGPGTLDTYQPTDGKKKLSLLISPALVEDAQVRDINALRPYMILDELEFYKWFNARQEALGDTPF